MDISFGIFLIGLAFFFFLIMIWYEMKSYTEKVDTYNYYILIFGLFAMIFFVLAGLGLWNITTTDVFSSFNETTGNWSQNVVTTKMSDYQPWGWFSIIIGVFVLLLFFSKVFDMIFPRQ